MFSRAASESLQEPHAQIERRNPTQPRVRGGALSTRTTPRYFGATFDQLSLSDTVRLKTSAPGRESASTQK